MPNTLDRIARSFEPSMRAVFQQAIEAAAQYVSLDELERAIRTGNRDLVYSLMERAVAERLIPELKPFYDILSAAMSKAGSLPVVGATIGFSITNPRVQRWIMGSMNIVIPGLANQTLQSVRRVIYSGYTEGLAPRVQARTIRHMVGLTPRLSDAVTNYGRSLSSLDLAEERQGELVGLYTHRLKTHRANSIARNETYRATMAGQYEAWGERFATGKLQSTRTWVKWLVVDDDRLCPYCRPMDGKRIRADRLYGGHEKFTATEKGGVEPVYRTRKPDPFGQKRDLLGRFAKAAPEVRPLTEAERLRMGPVKHPPLHIQCRCTLVLEFS